ncbi:MAG: DUF1232 domain-containing protein [Lachnospiraceae bacterium]|nr:DUF1232 domain-containing protein [Lachnospiraceae bacterium]
MNDEIEYCYGDVLDKDGNVKEEYVRVEISARTKDAEELLQDEDKMERFLQRLERKLKKVPAIGDKLSNVPVLISLIRSYIRKEYDRVPYLSLISIVAALLYFLSPVDLIPDFVPGIGYIDDAFIITTVCAMMQDDVDEYKQWLAEHPRKALPEETVVYEEEDDDE